MKLINIMFTNKLRGNNTGLNDVLHAKGKLGDLQKCVYDPIKQL